MNRIKSAWPLALIALLSACGSTPERDVETRNANIPVVEAQSRPVEPGASQQPALQPQQAIPQQTTLQAPPAIPQTSPEPGAYLAGDGPGENVPANLEITPDAVPRAEPLHRYANRPYIALNQKFTPQTTVGNYKKRGIASWYGKKFHGVRTSSGERYDMYAMTAAHPTLPIPSYARVTNVATRKSVVVRINDRGPFMHNRIIDLSYTAAHKLGIAGKGSGEVEVESLVPESGISAPAIAEIIMVEPLPATTTPAPDAASASSVTSAPAAGNVYLQIGAFKTQQGAENFLARVRGELENSGQQVMLYPKDDLVRVHIGPYDSQDSARGASEKIQARLGFKPIISLH